MAISFSRRTKVILLMGMLVLASLAAGFVLGAATAKAVGKKKNDPALWKPAAMKQLEKLRLSDAQRRSIEASLDQAVAELSSIRTDTVHRAKEIVARSVAEIDRELTPEQQERFEKIKPRNLSLKSNQ